MTNQRKENQKILSVLAKLHSGQTLKQIAVDEVGANDFEKRQRSLSVLLRRFSKRVCEVLQKNFGPRSFAAIRDGLLVDGPQANGYLLHFFNHFPGVSFPEHLPALREALKRGLSKKR